MAELRLDEEHRYWLNERRIWGVSEVLKDNGLIKGEDFYTELGRVRGQMVHDAMNLLAWDNLDWDPDNPESLDPQIFGYVHSGFLYLQHTKAKPRRTEFQAYHPQLFYAGTWDFDGSDWQTEDLLFDYKSGAVEKWHKIQTASYRELATVNHVRVEKRGGVYLQKDGSIAKFIPHEGRDDWKLFVSALNMTNARAAL